MRLGFNRLLLTLAVTAFLAGCEGAFGTKEDESAQEQPQTETPATTGTAESGAAGSTSALGSTGGFQGHPLDDPDSPLSNRTLYFEFNSSDIRGAERDVIEAHAKYLASSPSASVTLEGHADERGSREYNVALGERRATAVRQFMALVGVSGQQIKLISYGEERPVADGHDESAWRLNRRVEIIYRTR